MSTDTELRGVVLQINGGDNPPKSLCDRELYVNTETGELICGGINEYKLFVERSRFVGKNGDMICVSKIPGSTLAYDDWQTQQVSIAGGALKIKKSGNPGGLWAFIDIEGNKGSGVGVRIKGVDLDNVKISGDNTTFNGKSVTATGITTDAIDFKTISQNMFGDKLPTDVTDGQIFFLLNGETYSGS